MTVMDAAAALINCLDFPNKSDRCKVPRQLETRIERAIWSLGTRCRMIAEVAHVTRRKVRNCYTIYNIVMYQRYMKIKRSVSPA